MKITLIVFTLVLLGLFAFDGFLASQGVLFAEQTPRFFYQ